MYQLLVVFCCNYMYVPMRLLSYLRYATLLCRIMAVYLTVLYIFTAACTISLVLVCGLYGVLESIAVLRRLRNCRDIIIIIFNGVLLKFGLGVTENGTI